MSREAFLKYRIPEPGVDSVAEIAVKLKSARDAVIAKYGQAVHCSASLDNPDLGTSFVVYMEELQPGNLEPAMKEYFSVAGTPSSVTSGSDYESVKRALKDSGKSLRRHLLGLSPGRRVVPVRA